MASKTTLTDEQRAARNLANRNRRVLNLQRARNRMTAQAAVIAETFLRIEEVEIFLGRSRASLYRDVKANRLPPPVKVGPRCSRWRLSELNAALAA